MVRTSWIVIDLFYGFFETWSKGRVEWRVFSIAHKLECGNVVIEEVTIHAFKIGHGFDIHYLKPSLPFFIGGNNIPMITTARPILMMCHIDKFVTFDSCIGWVFIGSFCIDCHDIFFCCLVWYRGCITTLHRGCHFGRIRHFWHWNVVSKMMIQSGVG